MKNLLILALLFSTGVAFAAKTGDDSFQIGNPTSSNDKKLLFDTGDGAANKYILLDHSLKELSTNVDKLTLGTGAAANQSIIFNRGGSNPTIRWNEVNSVLEFTNDGSSFTNIGSGSGAGGGGLSILATNADFEQSLALGWTATGLSFTAATSGSNLLFGKQSAIVDSSATGQTLVSDAYVVPVGLYGANCQAKIYYKGGDATYKLQALDGSNALISEQLFPGAALVASPMSIYFPCPSSGSMKLAIASTANGAAMAIDRASIGEADIGSTNQAKFIGSAHIDNSGCSFTTNRGTLGSFDTNASCLAPVVDLNPGPGTIDTTTVTHLPKFTFKNLPPGDYAVTVHVTTGQAGGNSGIGISDGSTTSGVVGFDNTIHTATNTTGHFSYSNAGDHTFEIVGISESANTIILYGDTAGIVAGWNVAIEVTQYPSTVNRVFTPSQVANSWSGYHGGSGGSSAVWFTTSTTLNNSQMIDDAGAVLTETHNVNFGTVTSTGANKPGIVWTPSRKGSYLVCVQVPLYTVASNHYGYLGIADGNGKIIATATNTNGSSGNEIHSVSACGILDAPSTAPVSANIYLAVDSGSTNSIETGSLQAHLVDWTVFQIDYALPAPVLVNSVVSPSSGVEVTVRAKFGDAGGTLTTPAYCAADPCTVYSQSGSWVTAINRVGTGNYTLHIAAGTFSAPPTCSYTVNNYPSDPTFCVAGFPAANTSTAINIYCSDHSTVLDSSVDVICMGPK